MYGVIAVICGSLFLLLAHRLNRSGSADRRGARRLFLFSIPYLFVLFAALLADSIGDPSSSTLPTREDARRITRSVPIAALQIPRRTAAAFAVANTDEA